MNGLELGLYEASRLFLFPILVLIAAALAFALVALGIARAWGVPEDEAIALIKNAIKKTFGTKGEDIVKMNWAAVDGASDALDMVKIPAKVGKAYEPKKLIGEHADALLGPVVGALLGRQRFGHGGGQRRSADGL